MDEVVQKKVLKHSRVLFQPFNDRRRENREGRVGRREERCGRRQFSEERSNVNIVLQEVGDVMTFLDDDSLKKSKILLNFFACRMPGKTWLSIKSERQIRRVHAQKARVRQPLKQRNALESSDSKLMSVNQVSRGTENSHREALSEIMYPMQLFWQVAVVESGSLILFVDRVTLELMQVGKLGPVFGYVYLF